MHIINGNNEVFEIKDPLVVQRFTNLRPDGEPLVVSGFENGIRLEDVVEVCVYGFGLSISKSEDNLADLEIGIQQGFSITRFTVSKKDRIEQLSVCLGWEEIKNLPECIWYMKNLNELRLLNLVTTTLQENLGKLGNLSNLDLTGTGIVELPGSIVKLSSLSSLNLSGTELTELPESIVKLSSLSSLNLSRTKLTELPESIGNLNSLSSLNLSGTELTELPESIGKLSSLSSLDLNVTKLTELPESIGKLSSLSSLNLSGTELTELPESIVKLSSLSNLDLSFTGLTKLPESIGNLNSLSRLNLSDTGLSTLPESIVNLSSLSSLDLSDTGLSTLPESIGNLSNLISLNLSGTGLSKLPESIGNLSSLSSLDLSRTELRELPESIGKLSSLSSLELSNTLLTKLPESIGKLSSLSSLYLSRTELTELPESIVKLSSLSSLNLSGTELTELPESIVKLSSLSRLNLSDTGLSTLPESIGNLSNLISLNLSGTGLSTLPESIGKLSSLSNLDLSFTGLTKLPESIGNLNSLSRLNLSDTGLSTLPESIGNLSSLSSLDLSYTELTELPESIGNLSSLSSLYLSRTELTELPGSIGNIKSLQDIDLRYLNLDAIPESLLSLQLEFRSTYDPRRTGIQIEGLTLRDQPIEIFSQSRDLILAYYKSQEKSPINECKVIFLGDGGAGKSLIIDRLMKDGEPSPDFDGVSTPGIKITSKEYQIKDDKIELHFWDFGGQAIMHSMHRLFLTNRTLYVVVTNARDNKANEQAWYWIRNIKSFAKGAPVFLLINQKDQNPSANINETGLRKEYPQIKGVSIVSAKEDTTEEFNKLICDEICKIVSEMESVHTPFPQSWHLLMDDLQKMKTDYINSKEFREKCKDKGIDIQQDILDQIISWYQDLGVCFYSRKHPVERRYMVLKPKWLLNALYILSFNGRKYAKNGIIRENEIYELICEPVPDKDIKKVWSDISYEPNEIQYIINVLLNFNLVYRIDNEQFFVPMLCDENEPRVIEDFETEDAIHVSFKYEYLPENVLHRLMVLHGFELNRDLVWKTGAVLERKRLGWQALARSKDNCLDVYAKASDQETHPINSFLDIIRESVYRINSDFGLAAEEYITYAKDGKTDEFEYQWLEESKNAGLSEVYSRVFKTRIRIDEIIGIIKSPNLLQSDIDYIYECVMSACKQIQAKKIYWNKPDHIVSEDDRNDEMRDLISNRGLFVRDQTHAGLGQEGKNPGEVDLMIMNSPTDAQALIETMVLAGVNTKYIKEHLDKLVDGYNDSGFRDLFLVSYVELERSKFSSFWKRYKNKVKELGTGNFAVNTEIAPEEDESLAWIKSIKITYDYAGEDIRVYHICARVAE